MKKIILTLLVVAGSLAVNAGGDWRETLGKVKDLSGDTGIAGFARKTAPAYITGDYAEKDRVAVNDMLGKDPHNADSGYKTPNGYRDKDGKWVGGYFDDAGAFVKGHEVKVLGGLPYGVGQLIMIPLCLVMIYLAIVKGFEPLLLLPIGFGGLLANCPLAGVTAPAMMHDGVVSFLASGIPVMQGGIVEPGGFLYYFFKFGIDTGVFPIMIFMGVGAMTDFGPLIANPKMALLGGAAQFGIFFALFGALGLAAVFGQDFFGCDPLKAAASIGIIGGADGPTAIFVTTKLAPHLLGPIAVAAYSYMALVPVIQPPIMRALTTKKERTIRMGQLRQVSKTETIIFPIAVTIIVSLLLPDAATLVGMLMLGNLMRVCGVVERINKTAQNELCNIVTIFLGLTVGATTQGSTFLTMQTIYIVVLGVIAFSFGTAGGVMLAKLMNILSGGQINPLIGSAGVSAVPMAARVSQKVGQEEDPGNFLLMHAMGPNVAGVIGSAVAAGVFIALFAH